MGDFDKDLTKALVCIYEFCHEDFDKLILLFKKVFILLNTWIVGKDLMKNHFLIKKPFMAVYIWKILQVLIIDKQ